MIILTYNVSFKKCDKMLYQIMNDIQQSHIKKQNEL